MRLRTKLQFVYTGAAGIFAFLFACMGNGLCFVFLALAIFDWHTGQRLAAEDFDNHKGN